MTTTPQPNPRHEAILITLSKEYKDKVICSAQPFGEDYYLHHTLALKSMRLACEEGEATIQSLRAELERVKGELDEANSNLLASVEPLRMYCNCGVSDVSMINGKYICHTCNKERKFI